MTTYRGLPATGVDLDRVFTQAEIDAWPAGHRLGLTVFDEAGRVFTFVKASAAIAAGKPVKSDGAYTVAESGNAGPVWAVAHVAIGINQYGFVQVRGEVTAEVAGSLADNTLVSHLADANGDLQAVPTVSEGGASTYAAGRLSVFGKSHSAEAGGLATVFIY